MPTDSEVEASSLAEVRERLATLMEGLLPVLPPVEMRLVYSIQFVDESTTSFPEVERPDFGPTGMAIHMSTADNPAAFAPLVESVRSLPAGASLLLTDAAGSPVGPETEAWWLCTTLVEPFVRLYFNLQQDLSWNADSFQAVFAQLVADLGLRTITHHALAPLEGLTAESDDVDLGEGVSIRRMTEAEKVTLFESSRLGPLSSPFFDIDDLTAWRSVATKAFERVVGDADKPLSDSTPDVLAALRLCHAGQVSPFDGRERRGTSFRIPKGP